MPTSLGPERGSVARTIRNDQDSLTKLLQLGLVVLVSAGRVEVTAGVRRGVLTLHPPPSQSFFSRAPRGARSQSCQTRSITPS